MDEAGEGESLSILLDELYRSHEVLLVIIVQAPEREHAPDKLFRMELDRALRKGSADENGGAAYT